MEHGLRRKNFCGGYSSKKLINDVNTLAVVSLPGANEDERMLNFAVQEFLEIYKRITGKDIAVVYVGSISELNPNLKYFILGANLATDGGLSVEGLTTDTGYCVCQAGMGIYLYGLTGYGTLNAVYALFNQVFGLEFYTDTIYTVDRTYFDSALVKNVVFNPSIDNVWAMDGTVSSDGSYEVNLDYQRRLGFVNSWQIYNGSFHNFLDVVPYSVYGTEHPDWYTETTAIDSGNKFLTLCLAEGGDEMARVVARYMYEKIVASDKTLAVRDLFFFGPPDARGWSETSASAALKSKYGSYSAEYVLFMNKVAKIFNDSYTVGRKIKLCMMAYNAVLEAPAYSAELSFYNSDKISLNVMYAPVEANYYRALTDDSVISQNYGKTNEYYLNEYKKWQRFGGEVYYWRYSAQFDNSFVPVDTISNMQATYKAIAEYDVKNFSDQGACGSQKETDFAALKTYVKIKLAKNVDADVETLVKNFCNAYYGAGGEDMYALLQAERAWYKILSDTVAADKGYDPFGSHVLVNADIFNKKYWDDTPSGVFVKKYDSSMLKGWYEKYVLGALAKTANGTVQYANVKTEGLAVRYMLCAVYGDTTYGDFAAIAADAKALGITRFAEGKAWASSGKYVDGAIDNLA